MVLKQYTKNILWGEGVEMFWAVFKLKALWVGDV
jgi:hypothetical protein